jgi:hypothetical protein
MTRRAQHDITTTLPTLPRAHDAFTMPLLRRRLRCHFCNQPSRDALAHPPRSYECPHCDAINYFDEVP